MSRFDRIAKKVAGGLVNNFSNLEKEVASLQKELLRVRSSFRDTFEAVQSDMERNRAEPLKMRKIQGLRDKVMSWFDDADGALDSIRTEADVISVTLPPGMERYAASLNQTQEDVIAKLKEKFDFDDYEVTDFQGHIVVSNLRGGQTGTFLIRRDGKVWQLKLAAPVKLAKASEDI